MYIVSEEYFLFYALFFHLLRGTSIISTGIGLLETNFIRHCTNSLIIFILLNELSSEQ